MINKNNKVDFDDKINLKHIKIFSLECIDRNETKM